MVTRQLFALHRWCGLAAALALLIFGSSGLLHIALSRLQPQPVAFSAPAVTLPGDALAVSDVLRRHGIDSVSSVRSVAFKNHVFYRVRAASGTLHYFEVTTGKRYAYGERHHAEALARHFSGDQATSLASADYLTTFDAEYLPVNRLLPVWRVALARPDGLTVFIDTEGNRLATLTNDGKRWLQSAFRLLHNFDWAVSLPWLRQPLMLLLVGATAITAVAGLMLWRRRPHALPGSIQRWHRRIGLGVVITTLAFTVSGLWRLLLPADPPLPASPTPQFPTAALTGAPPADSFVLIDTPAGPCWLATVPIVASRDHAHHHHGGTAPPADGTPCSDSHSGVLRDDAERQQAIALARHYAGSTADATEASLLRGFDHEYGFINKRLPVWRVVLADAPTRWYVETTSGTLARRIDTAVAIEGLVFSWLHKWQFFGDARGPRDALQVLFVSGNISVGLLGLLLWRRRFRRNARPRRH